MKGVWLSQLAQLEVQRTNNKDANRAAQMLMLSERMQLAVAALLESAIKMEDGFSADEFLKETVEGDEFLMAASKYRCTAVLGHPRVQSYVESLWLNWMESRLEGHPSVARWFVMVACVLVQILLMPFVALVPRLGKTRRLGFLYDVPALNFLAASLVNLSFMILLMRFTARPNLTSALLLSLWALSDSWHELAELTDSFRNVPDAILSLLVPNKRSDYLVDPFNIFDLLGSSFASTGLVICVVESATLRGWSMDTLDVLSLVTGSVPDEDILSLSSSVRTCLACAVFFDGFRMLRVLSMSEQMGPFVLMFLSMFSDIAQWLSLLSVVLLSSSTALYVVHVSSSDPRAYHSTTCDEHGTPFVNFFGSFLKLFEGSLYSEPYFECIAHLTYDTADYWIAEAVAIVYQVIVALLLVNMLIAKMAKTFDAIWENQGLNYMFLRARTVMTWDSTAFICPPFVALSVPTLLLAYSMARCRFDITFLTGHNTGTRKHTGSTGSEVSGTIGGTFDVKGLLRHAFNEQYLTRAEDASVSRQVLCSSNTIRYSATARKIVYKPITDGRQSEQDLTEIIETHIIENEDEVSQNERWRTQMNKRNANRFSRLEKSLTILGVSLKELKRNAGSILKYQEKLEGLEAEQKKMHDSQAEVLSLLKQQVNPTRGFRSNIESFSA